MKTVLFFSCEPGGAEALIPAVRLLEKQNGLSVSTIGYGLGRRRFDAHGIACHDVGPIRDGDLSVLDRFQPSLIITSAASLPHKDMSEKFLWKNARTRGIPTLAFVDQWQNYAIRFSGPAPSERLAYLPDVINCINEIGRDEMIAEGFRNDTLRSLGHPYLTAVRNLSVPSDISALRRKLGVITDQQVVLFVSEPIKENYDEERGYTQYSVLEFLLSDLLSQEDPSLLVLKLHSKDVRLTYESFLNQRKKPALILSPDVSPMEAIQVADVVLGMSSIMLIEAFIMGKKVISVQPGLRVKDPFVLSRHGFVRVVRSKKDWDTPWQPANFEEFHYAFKEKDFLALVASMISRP